jgi:hypothetical protein
MSQVMKREIEAAGSPHRCTKGHRAISLGLVLTGAKRRCDRNGVNPTGLQRVCQYRGHGHAARFPLFGAGRFDSDEARPEVRITPGQCKQLKLPKASMQGRDTRLQVKPTVR